MSDRPTAARASAAAHVEPRAWAEAMLWVVATKPFADAFSARTLEDRLDPGAVWSLAAIALLAAWVVRRRPGDRSVQLALAAWVALGGLGAVAALGWAGVGAAVEIGKVLAGLAPLIVWLGTPPEQAPRWRGPLIALAAGMALHAGAAWLQAAGVVDATYTQTGAGRTFARPSGLYYHPVTLGYLLTFGALIAALLQRRGRVRTALAAVAVAIAVPTVVLTTHRAGTAAVVLVVLAWLATWRPPRDRTARRRALTGLAVAVVGVLAIAYLGRDVVGPPVARLVDGVVGVLREGDLDPTDERFLRGRGAIWADAVERLAGADGPRRWLGFGEQVLDPHSDYLRLPLVHGVVGTLLLVALLGGAMARLGRRCDATGAWALGVAVLLLLAYAVTTKPTSYPSFLWLWSLVAYLAAATSVRSPAGGGAR